MTLIEIKNKMESITCKLDILYPNFFIRCISYHKLQNRYHCHFSFDDKKKVSTTAKLILESKIGRLLTQDETTDHIDGDTLNDIEYNLMVLSRKENSSKGPSSINSVNKAKKLRDLMLSSSGDYCRGENNKCHKLSKKEVDDIRTLQLNNYRGQDKILANKYNVSKSLIVQIRLGHIWNTN